MFDSFFQHLQWIHLKLFCRWTKKINFIKILDKKIKFYLNVSKYLSASVVDVFSAFTPETLSKKTRTPESAFKLET